MIPIDRSRTALADALDDARRGFTGRQSLFAKNLSTGERIAFDAETEVPTASVIKIPIMLALYHEIDQQRLDEHQLRSMQEADRKQGTGIIRDLTVGREFSFFDLCRLMIALSDNTATRMIARSLGVDRINDLLRTWGFPVTTFRYETWEPHDPREYAVSSAREMAEMLERLDAGALLSPASTAAALGHLRAQQDDTQLRRWVPYPRYLESCAGNDALQIWNKTGQMQGVRTDAAIFQSSNAKWIVVSFTRDSVDHSYRLEHEGNLLNARTGSVIYDAWGRKD